MYDFVQAAQLGTGQLSEINVGISQKFQKESKIVAPSLHIGHEYNNPSRCMHAASRIPNESKQRCSSKLQRAHASII